MKRLYFLMLMLLLAVTCVYGTAVNSTTAERVAGNFALERLGANYTVASSKLFESSDKDSYIHVINLNPTGFILVAADDAALPIIGYSTSNKWNEYDIPPQMQNMLKSWNDQMRAIVTQRMAKTTEITREWNKYNVSVTSFSPSRDFRDVSPLITSLWGQGTYYNAQCPSGTPVGCVATAMAQIMRYWRFPTVGQGSKSYTCNPYGTQSADFGSTTYNWAAMPNSVTSANVSVATIGRHAGVAVSMQYAPSGSGAYSEDVPGALISYFRYSNTAQLYNKSSYNTTTWDTMMRGELDNGRPIYYSGSGSAGGHAFIVDGYTGTNSFHLNWGWNGSYNGYFTLAALNPGGDTFNSGQQAVIGIKPSTAIFNLSEGFEGTTFPPTGWTLPNTGFARSATNFITGAYSARYNATGTGAATSGKQIRTTKLTINASSPALTFKARAGTTSGRGEQFKVGYSTTGSAPFTYFATNAVLTTSATTFTYAVNGLTPGDYYFVFETYSAITTSNSKTWIIDDVAGPALWIDPNPIAAINVTTWAAGSLLPGNAAYSGDTFQLSNTGQGTLTVSSITNLSATEFKTNFPSSGVSLVNGQVLEFGFSYEPLNYGTDNQSFVITTNAGTITVNLSGSATSAIFSDSFETYTDFTLTFAPWTQYDGDLKTTYTVTGITFTNQGYTGSYIIFNPSATTPALSSAEAHTGAKYAACMNATSTPWNNDWLISPILTITGSGTLKFWAKSYTDTYGLERFKVLYSTTTNTYTSFTTYLAGSASTYVEAPTTWTEYTYTLPSTARYFAIQCVSADAFFLMLDDVVVSDGSTPPPPTFGNVSGNVYRYGTSTPIVNAMVTAGTKIAYTDVNGFYQINNLLTGTQSVTCSATGQFYFNESVSGVAITNGATTTQNFGLKWGELTASPASVTAALYQGETGSATVTLSNPGGTASTTYAGYFASAAASAKGSSRRPLITTEKKPSPEFAATRIPKINAPALDRSSSWFSYASIAEANLYSGALNERGNYFLLNDFALMDGAVTISQLRGYFYNPSAAAWTTTTHRTFAWKVYSVSSTGTVTLLHTSASILLPSITAGTYTLNEYTLPTAVTIPAGYDFIVTAKPSSTSDTSGRPQSLATDASTDNGVTYSSTSVWASSGTDYLVDAYVNGTEWLSAFNFSGSITPAGTVDIPVNFNTVGVTAGTKLANMYVYNNSNYVAPSANNRGDVLVVPISLTVTVPTTPIAVLSGTSWTTNANVGTPSTSGNVHSITNVGTNGLDITSITGLTGTPFTTNLTTVTGMAQNVSQSFGFTFTPTASGIYTATCTISFNVGTPKTVTLKGYANYISEGFEGATFPPDGWSMVDSDADTYNWMQYTATGAAHTGTYCAGSESYRNDAKSDRHQSSSRLVLTPNNWLITPRLAISSGDVLSYWIAAQDAAWPAENYSVKISTTNNQVASFTTTLFTETLTNGTWYNRTVNLNAYAGQSVYLAFQHHSCSDQFVLKLDDVLMPGLAAPLVYGNISGVVYKSGTSTPIVGATVSVAGRNVTSDENGAYTISNIVVDTYSLTASATGYINYSDTVTIPANSTLSYNIYLNYAAVYTANTTFNTTVSVGGSTAINVQMTNTGNSALTYTTDSGVWGGNTYPQGNMNETWETGDLTGWAGSVGANSDIYGSVAQPYGYLSDMTWVFASTGETTVQYLITPKLRVTTGNTLAFWYKQFNASSESFEVRISTTDTNFASFTSTLASVGPLADTNWTNFSQSLNAYAGQDIYVMFYYPRVDAYEYGYVMIDNITGPIKIAAPTGWLSCAPTSGTLAAGNSSMLNLNINAATLPVGTYTAQTWVFSNGLVSPYKLYVTLNVQAATAPAAPVVSGIEAYPGGIGIAWEESDNAVAYKVYGCNTPYGTFTVLGTTEATYMELTDAELAGFGLTAKGFFKVTADSEALRTSGISVQSKTSSPLLQNYIRPDKTKKLNVLRK